jgi:hypothetical protein
MSSAYRVGREWRSWCKRCGVKLVRVKRSKWLALDEAAAVKISAESHRKKASADRKRLEPLREPEPFVEECRHREAVPRRKRQAVLETAIR